MIKLTYDKFMSFGFVQTMQKLNTQPLPTKTAYAIKKLSDAMQVERKNIQDAYLFMIKPFAKKDADGNILHEDKANPEAFDVADDQMEAYKVAEKEFSSRETAIDRPLVPLSALLGLQFTAAELSVLDGVVDPEDAPQAVAPVVGSIGPKAGA